MNNKYIRKINSTYDNKTLLDTSIPKPKLKFTGIEKGKLKSKILSLPKPLKPSKYTPQKPVPKPRTKKSKNPVPLPRLSGLPRQIKENVKNFNDKIKQYYKPDAIRKFEEMLSDAKNIIKIIREKAVALKKYAKTFDVSILSKDDAAKQLSKTRSNVFKLLKDQMLENRGIKFQVNLSVLMKKEDSDGNLIFNQPQFNSFNQTIINEFEIQSALDKADELIKERIAKWVTLGSGWIIDEVKNHYVSIVKYDPLSGSSYIPLPKNLRNSMKGLINIKNEDDKCLLWNIVRYHNPVKHHAERITMKDREFAKTLDFTGITFPVTIKQIPKVEKQNNIKINVMGYEDGEHFPMYTSREKYKYEIDVLYIDEFVDGKYKSHYVLIKNFNRLMTNITKHHGQKHFCKSCYQWFNFEVSLEKHKTNCIVINGVQAIQMPKKYIDKYGKERAPNIYFKNHHKQLPVPFVIVADFESIIEKVSSCQQSEKNLILKNTKSTQLVYMVIKLFAFMTRNIQEI